MFMGGLTIKKAYDRICLEDFRQTCFGRVVGVWGRRGSIAFLIFYGLSGYTRSVRDFESMRSKGTPMSVPPTSHKLDSRNDHRITPQTVFNS